MEGLGAIREPEEARPRTSVSPLGLKHSDKGERVCSVSVATAVACWFFRFVGEVCCVTFLGLGANANRGIQTSTSVAQPQGKRSRRSTSTARHNRSTHGFHCNRRYSRRRPARTTWQGSSRTSARNFLNSIVNRACRSAARGCNSASQAFRLQANAAITMYAPLDNSVFDGARNARTPFLSCSIRFSWLQRSLAKYTTASRSQVHRFVREKK